MTSDIATFNERLQKAKDNRGGGTDIGNCFDRMLLKEIITAFPKAPISITLRNHHFFGLATELHVKVEGLGHDNAVSDRNVTLHEMLPSLMDWIHDNHMNGVVLVTRFLEEGQTLANILGRELEIVHEDHKIGQDGSTSKKMARGPFKPQQIH